MQNQLYYGDNLEVLRKYIGNGTIDLCYIDPPFNSKRNYNQIYNNIGKEDKAQAQAFIDTWTWNSLSEDGLFEILNNFYGVFTVQSIELIKGLSKVLGKGSLLAYLISMTLRIAEIFRVLKPTGSFYFHCDPTASHYLKLIIDAIFCSKGGDFQNEIIWKRFNFHADAKRFGNLSDRILFYTKSSKFTFNTQREPFSEKYVKDKFTGEDERGKFSLHDLNPPGGRGPIYNFHGISRPWRFTENKMKALDADGRIYKEGKTPRLKRYLNELKGQAISDIWIDIFPINSQAKERLGYPTQKPEDLLKRLIEASSNEGDVILDAYCGCGTTIAVAEKFKRNWIGIDITYQSISVILKRMEEHFGKAVIENINLNGVPKDFESAVLLAHKKDDRLRKEFEKWAVLSYSNNRAMINEKKGGDGGIDGIAYIYDKTEDNEDDYKQVIFSVKSNKTLNPTVIRDLAGSLDNGKAAKGFLITLYPMENLVKESTKYGNYVNKFNGLSYPKIEVISIKDILNGKRFDMLVSQEILKKAVRKNTAEQEELYEKFKESNE
ncbi:MAG: methyltransferase [Ignavibacteria bacterium]|nr:methyltransferase [Ignavibacteria bacterium]